MSHSMPSRRPLILSLLAAAVLLAVTAASARAADTIYWANYSGGTISFANLAGGGGGNLDTTGASAAEANGVAIDAAAGKIYWITAPGGKVFFANLSGGGGGELNTTGATTEFPVGLAIDPAAGRVYWASGGGNKIAYANLNGSGGGDLDTTGATVEDPLGVTIDHASGRIYWVNGRGSTIVSYANLAGGGGGDLNTAGATAEEPNSPVIDAANGRIYWENYEGNSISFANLNGSGGGDLSITGATLNGPFGAAIDPASNRIYWTNEIGNSLSYANLATGQGADLDTSGATVEGPAYPVILKTPSPATAPLVSGGPKAGSTLSCTPGTWSGDLLESFVFQVPQTTSLQWLENGQPVAGATATTLTASTVGSYSCQSTAANHAGAGSQTSAPVAVFSLGKTKQNRHKGTATLPVTVPGPGTLALSGKQLVKQSRKVSAASKTTIKLLVKAKGKALKALLKKGKVKLKATVTFTPATGTSGSQTKRVVLRKEKPKPHR
ncbi:MAG TPA: hypothetical protein VFX44_00370 [Solirubrobacterales bacterium]|nr:hypothetical protein [Solirubrobacterales bacterium]